MRDRLLATKGSIVCQRVLCFHNQYTGDFTASREIILRSVVQNAFHLTAFSEAPMKPSDVSILEGSSRPLCSWALMSTSGLIERLSDMLIEAYQTKFRLSTTPIGKSKIRLKPRFEPTTSNSHNNQLNHIYLALVRAGSAHSMILTHVRSALAHSPPSTSNQSNIKNPFWPCRSGQI